MAGAKLTFSVVFPIREDEELAKLECKRIIQIIGDALNEEVPSNEIFVRYEELTSNNA